MGHGCGEILQQTQCSAHALTCCRDNLISIDHSLLVHTTSHQIVLCCERQLYAGATAGAAVFLVFVYLLFTELQFTPIFLSVLFCGLFANAAAPITLELASELTFPVGEETSATLLVVFFSVIQLAFIEFSDIISAEAMNWANAGVLGAATVGLLLVPGDSMRKNVDIADISGGDPVAIQEVKRLLRNSDSALPVPTTYMSQSQSASATE